MRNVIDDEKRFDRVHIGVAAAVILGFAEGFVPGFQAHLLLFAPEVFLDNGDGLIKQRTRLRVTGGDRTGGTQQDEEVLITLFGGIDHTFIIHAGVPAAVLLVAQRAVQGFNAMIDQRIRAGAAHSGGDRIDVQHACGDPQMRAHIASHLTVIAQPAKTGRDGGVFTKIQNAIGLLFQPAVVAESVKPFHVHVLF
ncbi:hypothetical protein D3C80_799850 [compost metagenome]